MVVAIATLITFVENINTTRTSNVTASTERNNLVFDTYGGSYIGFTIDSIVISITREGKINIYDDSKCSFYATGNAKCSSSVVRVGPIK